MRKPVARIFLLASLSVSLATSGAYAQKGKDPKGNKGGGTAQPVEIDDPPVNGPNKAADNSPPPTAGQMTEQAAQAKRLFDGEKWEDSALALDRVRKGETGDDEGNKQLAQFHLAIALYRMKFYQAAYAIFSEIADKPNHLKFNDTLLWLSKLATDLPEPADIVERVKPSVISVKA